MTSLQGKQRTGMTHFKLALCQHAFHTAFQLQQAKHIAAPILVISAIADHSDRMCFSKHFGQRRDIAKIVL